MDSDQLAPFVSNLENRDQQFAENEETETEQVNSGPLPMLNPTYEPDSRKVAWQCPRCVKCYVVWGDHADPENNGKLKGAVSRIRGHISKHHGEKYMIGMHPIGFKKTQPKYNGEAPNSCPAKIAGKNVKCVLPCAEGAQFCDVHSKMPREKVIIFNKDIHVPKKLLSIKTMSNVIDHQLMPIECQLDPLGQVLNYVGVMDYAQSSNVTIPPTSTSTPSTTQYRKRKSSQPSEPVEMVELADGSYLPLPALKDRKHKAPRTIADLLPAPNQSSSDLRMDGKQYPTTIHQNGFDSVSSEQVTKAKSRGKKIIQHSRYAQAVDAGSLPSTILPVSVDQLVGFPQQSSQAHDNNIRYTSADGETSIEMQFTPNVTKNPVGRPRKSSSVLTNSAKKLDESSVFSALAAIDSSEETLAVEQLQEIHDINFLGEGSKPINTKPSKGKGSSIKVDHVVFSADSTEPLESSPFAFVAGKHSVAATTSDEASANNS